MRERILPLMAAGLLLVACGSGQQEQQSSESSAAAAADETSEAAPDKGKNDAPEQAPEDPAPGGGSMIATYQDATSPEALRGKEILEGDHALEDMAADINETLNLPYDIPLLGAQCDQPNAFWSPSEKTITICYEDTSNSERIFTELKEPDPVASAINAEWATFYHEVGHMTVTIYNLPITGREEDVADQLAAYVLLQPGDDGAPDMESVQAVKDFAKVFDISGEEDGPLGDSDFADEHTLNEARNYNLLCWIYGSNPDANADIVTGGELPESRADGCQAEWQQLDNAWATLLDPYFK
ncbi:DUF4344 domain-containing metallopeptidase [Mycobacterium sp. 236(2023)]|uniref:DUF4344 domain-containing metallopeptidase n=1 Tax=Mycobacterium sp. 236(2023) TaxID=3038163 RepID=UPI0024156FD2|nr:DUF4344 domain-containing metallopeptidase [Mycobacterium sp. 236(2023)]MDG4663820.1 DUF4344 domain-containing metallopeptidase [Mycobacterium sp. 236(2023)]